MGTRYPKLGQMLELSQDWKKRIQILLENPKSERAVFIDKMKTCLKGHFEEGYDDGEHSANDAGLGAVKVPGLRRLQDFGPVRWALR